MDGAPLGSAAGLSHAEVAVAAVEDLPRARSETDRILQAEYDLAPGGRFHAMVAGSRCRVSQPARNHRHRNRKATPISEPASRRHATSWAHGRLAHARASAMAPSNPAPDDPLRISKPTCPDWIRCIPRYRPECRGGFARDERPAPSSIRRSSVAGRSRRRACIARVPRGDRQPRSRPYARNRQLPKPEFPRVVSNLRRKAGFAGWNERPVAETKGFEPSRRFPAYSLSRGAPSTTRPRLRGCV